jgi:hypothetical protein
MLAASGGRVAAEQGIIAIAAVGISNIMQHQRGATVDDRFDASQSSGLDRWGKTLVSAFRIEQRTSGWPMKS